MNSQQTATVEAIVNVFETGSLRGGYGRIALMKGDKGHLSYGRSQASLGSGSLFDLLDDYCRQPGTTCGEKLRPFLPRFSQRDVSLDTDQEVRILLKDAGNDPRMQQTQDRFFVSRFLTPALEAAQRLGITQPLGQAVVYDSHIQGGWSRLQPRVAAVSTLGEQTWIGTYIDVRRKWLLSLDPPLPSTVYRMQAFTDLIRVSNWFLQLPIVVHGVTIAAEDLQPALGGATARLLRLTTPYMRGEDVKTLQRALNIPVDGVYGPFTDEKLNAWKRTQNPPIDEMGAGTQTRDKLKLEHE
jgi:chitosanase